MPASAFAPFSPPDGGAHADGAFDSAAGRREPDWPMVEAKQNAMLGIVFCLAATVPPVALFSVYHTREEGLHYWIRLGMAAVLLLGPLIHLLLFRRSSVRFQAWWSVSWLTLASALAGAHLGPTLGGGLSWVLGLLVASFFLSPAASIAVLCTYALASAASVVLVHCGFLARPEDFSYEGGLASIMQIHAAGFVVLVLCSRIFHLMTEALGNAIRLTLEEHDHRLSSERARLDVEKKLQANQHFEAVGRLAGGVAHDFNNALTVIQCNAGLVKCHTDVSEVARLADDIIAAATAAAQTSRQLISLNRRAAHSPKAVNPSSTLELFFRMVGSVLPENITVGASLDARRLILIDPSELHQAILNLVLNARDAMPDGGSIRIRTEDLPSTGGESEVAITVSDTGMGMPPDVQARIFEPFFSTKAPGKGTGLGLTMVKSLVDSSKGRIAVRSEPGEGTSISLIFPESHLTAAAAAPSGPAHVARGERRSILLVEDDARIREATQRILEGAGYTVTPCSDAAEALARIDEGNAFDLLCTDGLTGGPRPVSELVDQFARMHSRSQVLLCSGHLESEDIPPRLGEGLAFLRKPYTAPELLARLSELAHACNASPVDFAGKRG